MLDEQRAGKVENMSLGEFEGQMAKERASPEPAEKGSARLDDAARAGWLYYVAGNTQDEIARKLSISRQSAQRLVALAVSHRLVKVRIDHPIAACMELAKALTDRFRLLYCDVTPSDPGNHSTTLGIANVAAAEIERWLARKEPMVIAMGTGEEMRATALQISPMECPQHKLVSLVGNIASDGSASLLDAVSRAADMVKAPHFPMPCPVIAATHAERDKIMAQSHVKQVLALARSADVTFVGVGSMVEDAPLVRDGFVSLSEMRAMMAIGSAGEIAGWAYDDAGEFIKGLTNERATGVRPQHGPSRLVVGVSMEPGRLRAIKAAFAGHLLNGLITNEDMARRLLG
jgi:DNA-binding transcriptional regulator LsrR (DeoR family)